MPAHAISVLRRDACDKDIIPPVKVLHVMPGMFIDSHTAVGLRRCCRRLQGRCRRHLHSRRHSLRRRRQSRCRKTNRKLEGWRLRQVVAIKSDGDGGDDQVEPRHHHPCLWITVTVLGLGSSILQRQYTDVLDGQGTCM